MNRRWRWLVGAAAVGLVAAAGLAVATWQALMPLPASLKPTNADVAQQVLAADGTRRSTEASPGD